MWITEHVAGAREFFTRWAEVLDIQPTARRAPSHLPGSPVQSPPAENPAISILGVPFEPLTFDATLDRVEVMIGSRQPHYIATANVDFLVQARHDIELRRILNEAALVLCDGTPILWLSRFFGNPLPERVAGSDLTPLLIERAAEKGYRVFFLGGQPEVAATAVAKLRQRHPGLIIAGHYSPPFKPLMDMDQDDIVERIRAAQPDIVFVSFGCPKAEKWMAMNFRKIGAPVMIGVGATIDFLAGRVKRAPRWMQASGTEWLFRLIQEPRRLFRRYARDFAELGRAVLGQWWHCQAGFRLSRDAADGAASMNRDDAGWLRLRPPVTLTRDVVARNTHMWQQARGSHCLIYMRHVERIDSTGLALLLRLHHRLRAEGRHLVLAGPNRALVRALHWAGFESQFLIARNASHARRLVKQAEREAVEPVVESSIDWTLPLTWRGEMTGANSELVWQRTHEYLSMCSARRKQTAIDMSAVRFLDTGGLAAMLQSRDYAHQLGMDLRFVELSHELRELIRRAGLEKRLFARRQPSPALPRQDFSPARIPAPAV